jgi:hypothetical protein
LISGGNCSAMKSVLSETYIHMWDRNFDLPVSGSCTRESDSTFCVRFGKNCGAVSGTDSCGQARTVTACGSCASPQTCGGGGVPSVCGSASSVTYEAEEGALAGSAAESTCPEAYTKVSSGSSDDGATTFACSGGAKVRFIGNGSGNSVTFNNVNVASAGSYGLAVWAVTNEPRTFYLNVNGSNKGSLTVTGPDWHTPVSVTTTVALRAGSNSIRFYNDADFTADLDRIIVSTTAGSGGSGGTGAACATPWAQASCTSYSAGIKVSRGGHNWTCANANCMNCATYTSCVPGASGCPWGAVWTDSGACH